ncbi:LTA synthase family protein [Nocardioides antri]|uniref:Sulfatase-like hydrolase/transferase n=1 Tax=Nocardioides antri TaxID=2607659 RepID=A0A5B1M159_9ACTN|nr:sulfatase-like hydrolase/transferase [Nocardioides antri]KAA1425557.1 sulfatase-like hydrolase/transferase [Nocardioides antri]
MSTSSVADPPAEAGSDDEVDSAVIEPSTSEPAEPTDQPHRPTVVVRRGALLSLLVAVVLTLVLEVSTLWRGEPQWVADQFVIYVGFYVDTFVVWLALMFLWSLIGRLWWSIGVLSGIVLPIAAANRVKIHLREEPIYPSDIDFLSEPGFLSAFVSPTTAVLMVLAIALLVGGCVLVGRRLARRYPRPSLRSLPRAQAVGLGVTRAVVLLATATLLFQTTRFNEPGNLWREVYEVRGEHWRYWNQKTNYRSNGFLGGFFYNMPISAMAEPPGYDEAAMERITDRYTQVAARINRGRAGSLDDVNVILVLSESFTDPTQLDGFELERDPIPRIRGTMDATTSGTMLAHLYGGGTANMEFETLTGQSIALFRPQMVSPYQMLVSDYEDYPSAVGWFKSQGHQAIAIHPYMVGLYKREQVYRTFGFEEFIHDTSMQSQETIDDNPYIDDAAAFDEVLHQIDDNDDPLMINLVTMQNHIPVDGHYDDPIGVNGIDGDQADRIGQYARGLEHTDVALEGFLSDLEASDEKSVVLFYGDHLPGIYDSEVKSENDDDLRLYQTPFFVWSSEGNAHRPMPLTSPSFFLPLIYQVADAPVPPYLALLDRVHAHVSALQQGRIITSDGAETPADALDPRSADLLEDLRLVQYDFSIGQRYATEDLWPGAVD